MRAAKIILVLLLAVTMLSCGSDGPKESKKGQTLPTQSFNPDTLKIPDKGGRKLKGQVLYMPIYSNIPSEYKEPRSLNGFIAIHNTDLKNQIKITKVDFFNTEGKLRQSFVTNEQQLPPLATAIFTISREDQSGIGANFIVEWIAEQSVNIPLVETVMTDQSGTLGLSFLSSGRIIRELE